MNGMAANSLPAPRPSVVPVPLRSLFPMVSVVIKNPDLILPWSVRLTTAQSMGKYAQKFEAFFEPTTNCVFMKPDSVVFVNGGTVFDQSIAYTPQRNIQRAFHDSYGGDLTPWIWKSLTAFLCHLRYHMILTALMHDHGIDLATIQRELARKPKPRKSTGNKAKAAKRKRNDDDAAEDEGDAEEVADDDDDDGDDGDTIDDDPRYADLPTPAYLKQSAQFFINGIEIRRGRKAGTNRSLRVHVSNDEQDVDVKTYYSLLEQTATEAGLPVYAERGGPGVRLYPPFGAAGKTRGRQIIPRNQSALGAPATAPATPATAAVAVEAREVVSAPPQGAKRRRAAPRKGAKKGSATPTPAESAIATLDFGSDEVVSVSPPPAPSPALYTEKPAAVSAAFGTLTQTAKLYDLLRPTIKAPMPASQPGSPTRANGGNKSATLATINERGVIVVPLPVITAEIKHMLTEGVVHGRWLSDAVQVFMHRQPQLCDEARRNFAHREKHYVLVSNPTHRTDDFPRVRTAIASGDAASNRAVVDGVARGWTQLMTHGDVPARLEYKQYAFAVDDVRRYDRESPAVRRVGERFTMPDGSTCVQWGVQVAAERIEAGERIGVYRGREVRGGLVELSAEQIVYELGGVPPARAEDLYAYTEATTVGGGASATRMLSARGPDYYDSLMAYINGCGVARRELANVEWHAGSVEVRAKRTLLRGEMLCIDYGMSYEVGKNGTLGVSAGADEELPFVAWPFGGDAATSWLSSIALEPTLAESDSSSSSSSTTTTMVSQHLLADHDLSTFSRERTPEPHLPSVQAEQSPFGVSALWAKLATVPIDEKYANELCAFGALPPTTLFADVLLGDGTGGDETAHSAVIDEPPSAPPVVLSHWWDNADNAHQDADMPLDF